MLFFNFIKLSIVELTIKKIIKLTKNLTYYAENLKEELHN